MMVLLRFLQSLSQRVALARFGTSVQLPVLRLPSSFDEGGANSPGQRLCLYLLLSGPSAEWSSWQTP